ncbi:MAG: LysR family transcriptional regulator [Alphaproteobacteria bacterium]|nr:LysR family transcriptional regulator [Alphaproteobacteria bacterium]
MISANSQTLSLRHLRLFAIVARLGSIRRAAELFHLSQPAVTQAMIKLEGQVGVELLLRRSSGTFTTKAGDIFAARIDLMTKGIEDALLDFGVTLNGTKNVAQIADRITRVHIRSLEAIARGKSLADAARILDVSQPSIHRAARDLEHYLGKTIFQQSAQGVVATRAGSELSRRLSLALREIDWAIEEVHAASGHYVGSLRVGAMPMAGSILLAHVLNEMTQLYEGLHVYISTGSSAVLTRDLHLGKIDFLFGMANPDLDPLDFKQEELISSNYQIIAGANHPLAHQSSISPEDLSHYPWIMPVKGATRREAFETLFAQMKHRPLANIETHSLATIRVLMASSDSLTLMTKFEFDHERQVGDLIALDYQNIKPLHSLGVTTRASWKPTSIHGVFSDLVRQRALRSFDQARGENVPPVKAQQLRPRIKSITL